METFQTEQYIVVMVREDSEPHDVDGFDLADAIEWLVRDN
jgi:hypothetical protein